MAWFDDLCGGDTAFLGTLDPERRSNYAHCAEIIKTLEAIVTNPRLFTGIGAPLTRQNRLFIRRRTDQPVAV